MIGCVIIDDEQDARESLLNLIKRYFDKNIHVLCTASSVEEGVIAINKFKPELVFLDVEMPVENGFGLFQYFSTIYFDVIFTTAHASYAIDAIKFSALDYLLKPISFEDLDSALKRIERKQIYMNNQSRIETLLYNLKSESDKFNKIALPTNNGLQFEKINHIMYCVADGNYTTVCMIKNEKILVSRTMKYFEEMLPSEMFFRIHKSHIVNLNYIKYYNKSYNTIVLEDGTNLSVSMRKSIDFLTMLNQ